MIKKLKRRVEEITFSQALVALVIMTGVSLVISFLPRRLPQPIPAVEQIPIEQKYEEVQRVPDANPVQE